MVSAIHAPAMLMPLRAVEITAVSAPTMPEYRVEAFRETVAARLRAGVTPPTLIREQQALIVALADPEFEKAMVDAYVKEMTDQSPKHHISPKEAVPQMHGILNNRIRDAHGFVALLFDPEFVASAQEKAKQPAPHKGHVLTHDKKEEVIRRMIDANDPAGAEPAVHVAATALGNQMVHMALANIYRPKAGQLRAPLVDALARAWPDATGKQIEEAAVTWLKARHDMAHEVANGLTEEGELYKEAMRRITMPNLAPHPTPAAYITVPASAPGKLEAHSISIALGGI